MMTQPLNNILFVCGSDLLTWFEVDTSPRLVSTEQQSDMLLNYASVDGVKRKLKNKQISDRPQP